MRKSSYRERFIFWLDIQNEEQFVLAELISQLKRERRFVTTIRDGLRLVCDLRAGQTAVLFELFPWVANTTRAPIAPTTSSRPLPDLPSPFTTTDTGESASESRANFASGLGNLFDADDDFDADEIVIKRDTSTKSAANFLQAMSALNS